MIIPIIIIFFFLSVIIPGQLILRRKHNPLITAVLKAIANIQFIRQFDANISLTNYQFFTIWKILNPFTEITPIFFKLVILSLLVDSSKLLIVSGHMDP